MYLIFLIIFTVVLIIFLKKKKKIKEEFNNPSPTPSATKITKVELIETKDNYKNLDLYQKVKKYKNLAKKNLLQKSNDNDYIVNEDILLKINENIEIDNISIDNTNSFYELILKGNNTFVLFIPKKRDIGENKVIRIEASKDSKKIILEQYVNIYDNKELITTPEITNNYNFTVSSAFENDFQNNYLGESEINTPHLYKNPTVINSIKNKLLGEFEKKVKIDNPETWKQRVDINRPWISTYSEIFSDVYAKFNYSKKEKKYLKSVDLLAPV